MKNTRKVWIMSSSLALATVFALFAGSAAQATTEFDNGDGDNDWFNSNNWGGGVPHETESAAINAEGLESAVIDADSSEVEGIGSDTTAYSHNLYVGAWSNNGQLDIYTDYSFDGYANIGSRAAGTVNQHSGTVSSTGTEDDLQIGNDDHSATGTYNLKGGSLEITEGIRVGDPSTEGTLNISGGFMGINSPLTVESTGKVRVEGGGASDIIIGWDGSPTDDNDNDIDEMAGELELRVDAGNTKGLTPITVGDTINLDSGAELDVAFLNSGEYEYKSWTALDWGGDLLDSSDNIITTVSEANAALPFATGVDDSKWQREWTGLDSNGDGGSLSVTYVPEPSSLALLALGGLLLMKRRRRA